MSIFYKELEYIKSFQHDYSTVSLSLSYVDWHFSDLFLAIPGPTPELLILTVTMAILEFQEPFQKYQSNSTE